MENKHNLLEINRIHRSASVSIVIVNNFKDTGSFKAFKGLSVSMLVAFLSL
jgi:hypothetical protein